MQPGLDLCLLLDGAAPELELAVVLLADVCDDSTGLPDDKVAVGVVDDGGDATVGVDGLVSGRLHAVGPTAECKEDSPILETELGEHLSHLEAVGAGVVRVEGELGVIGGVDGS